MVNTMNTDSKFEPNDKLHEEMHAQIKKIHSTNCDYVNADVLHQYIDEIYMAAKSNHIPDTGKMVKHEQVFSDEEYVCIRDAVDRLMSAVGNDVDGDQSECSLCSEFLDDLIKKVINPLGITWVEGDDVCEYYSLGSPIRDHIAEAGKMIAPEFDAGLIAAILEDYANLQISGAIPCANRYSAADAVEQAELIEKAAVDHSVDANKMVAEWKLITEQTLKDQPDWLYGSLWVLCEGEAEVGYYEWEQGDRIKGDNIGNRHAIDMLVMPLVKPEPPKDGGAQ